MASTTQFQAAGSIQRPGPVGRWIRIFSGVANFAILTWIIIGGSALLGSDLPSPGWWVAIASAFFLLPYVINIGFTRAWGRWPQLVIVLLGVAAAFASFVQSGSFWGPPLGLLIFTFLLYVFGHLGVSFILAGTLATPGCEMRAIPHLKAVISGQGSAEHYCPVGYITPLDNWEAKRTKLKMDL